MSQPAVAETWVDLYSLCQSHSVSRSISARLETTDRQIISFPSSFACRLTVFLTVAWQKSLTPNGCLYVFFQMLNIQIDVFVSFNRNEIYDRINRQKVDCRMLNECLLV